MEIKIYPMINMKKNFKFLAFSAMLLFAIGVQTGCKDDSDGDPEPEKSIYEQLAGSKYSILKTAIDRVGLDVTLNGGTYTFLAPTDDAILLADTDPTQLSDADLEQWLNNHLIKGKFETSQLSNGAYITSEAELGPDGEKLSLSISTSTGSHRLNSAQINSTTACTNGILHEMSDVVEPANIYDHLLNNPKLDTYKTAVSLEVATKGELDADGLFTVFAVHEDAMVDYLNDKNVSISRLAPADRRELVNNGIINDKGYYYAELPSGAVTTRGEDLDIDKSGAEVLLNGSVKVKTKDVQCTNGVIHIIDGTLTN